MKKLGEKYNLVKVTGIMVLITVLLTWVVPQGMFQSGNIEVTEITRVGIFDFFTYGLLGLYYFTVLVTFVFVLGAFYQVLSRTKGYQALTTNIAKTFKGKEILFVLVVSFLIAAVSAITNEYILVLTVVPFVITIMSKMKLDKLTGFLATFGAVLVGVLGSVYSAKTVGMNVRYLSTSYSEFIWPKVILFAVAFIAFSVFTILHIRKNKKAEAIVDLFETTETNAKSKSKAWSICLVYCLALVIILLAYLPWATAWGANWTVKALESVTNAEVFGSTIFAYILGNVQAFGSWDIFGAQVVMLVATLVIKWIDRMSIEEVFEAFGEGFKKAGKLVIVLLLCYVVLEFTVMFPVIPTIVNWFMGLFSNASEKVAVLMSTVAGLFTSLFTVEYQYTASMVGEFLTKGHDKLLEPIAFMLTSTYGLASLFSPASAILFMGLSYLGITYKEWMKHIWKFLVLILLVIIVMLLILC